MAKLHLQDQSLHLTVSLVEQIQITLQQVDTAQGGNVAWTVSCADTSTLTIASLRSIYKNAGSTLSAVSNAGE